MLRTATFTAARMASTGSFRGVPMCVNSRVMTFHTSSHREEVKDVVQSVPPTSDGLFGTGVSEWYALPIGIAAAVPAIKFDWYVINEETQLAAVFVAFCVALYSSGGDVIYKLLDERAQTILNEHNETEDMVIQALQLKLDYLKANQNMVDDFQAINILREQTYENLNVAGIIKPQHDFKGQVERVLNMIAAEEKSVMEKTKTALMEEATAAVTAKFSKSKQLKRSALDAAIATIKGGKVPPGTDPVQTSFVKFFKEKAIIASKSDDGTEEKAQRATLIAKMNTVCKTEGFYFQFDTNGTPKMVV